METWGWERACRGALSKRSEAMTVLTIGERAMNPSPDALGQ